jgi:DNA-binding transcriptional ArsR family regulator
MPRSDPGPHNQPIALSIDKLNSVEEEELDLTFAALADPTRRAILTRLARGEATVKVLAEPFQMSLQAVSRHLKVLEGAGLITRGHNAQYRPRALTGAALEGATRWISHTQETWRRGMTTDEHEDAYQGTLETTAPSASAFTPQGDWAR